MLIDLLKIQEQYNIYPQSVLHVGAHAGEELELYKKLGAKNVYWIEANESLAKALLLKQLSESFGINNFVDCEVISDRDGDEVNFNISNNGQSSSILDLGEHSLLFPDVFYINSQKRRTSTISTVLKRRGTPKIDFLNLDIQGVELLALKGFRELGHVNFIYTEINSREVYKQCSLVGDIDKYLEQFNFYRAETKYWDGHPWGDALYLKRN